MTDSEAPRLKTPTGGAESEPERPEQWHGHPYVWAWIVSLGATSRTYIERECMAAKEESAPPDAVYKTRDNDPSMPSEWVTVDMVANTEHRTRVRAYAQALVDWDKARKAHRKQRKAQPSQGAEEPEQYEYYVAFAARISGKATAASYEEAMRQLAPPEHTADSGYVAGLGTDRAGVAWFLNFDSLKGRLVSTNDPRMQQPHVLPAPAVEPAVPAATSVGSNGGRGVVLQRVKPSEPQQ
ncbi:hypothetical protein [Streptomyces sp. NPDC088775]|uniref:hypothetical protein n=1 Tax=Streptomyces sp. NPDC088775 TaxID=3365896 RepID=UPI00381ED1F8